MDHQQICEFVNSKDVRKYLKDIGYEFSTPQAAWLVHRCQRLTMEERHKAWREIIRDMPDCAMEERDNMERIDSFHTFLNDYIELEKRGVQEFVSADNCVYRYECHKSGTGNSWDKKGSRYFSNYQHCIDDYKLRRYDENSSIDRVRIWKLCLVTPDFYHHQMDVFGSGPARCMILTPDLAILAHILMNCKSQDDCYDMQFAETFDGMCFDFPVPFRRGDILIDCTARDCKPFVLSYIPTWNSEKMLSSGFGESDCPDRRGWKHFDDRVEKRLKFGDFTDGAASGTVISERDGSFTWDHFLEATDMEYYREPLNGIERQLKVLSCYEKGELKARDLVNLCCAIRMESIGREPLRDFTDGFLESIGIRPKD